MYACCDLFFSSYLFLACSDKLLRLKRRTVDDSHSRSYQSANRRVGPFAQFSPLTKLSSGHFGLFWKELGDEWTEPGDGLPIPDQFELFDRPRPIGIQLSLMPMNLPGRFTLGHKSKDRLLQIQSTRFCLNWRKQKEFYPSYKSLIDEFKEMFARFSSFSERNGLGILAINQWELYYIDAFAKGEYWNTPADWAKFLPGLFGQPFPVDGLGIVLEHRAAEWSYEIQPNRGRLHLSARPGKTSGDNRELLLLQTVARGPVEKGSVARAMGGT